MSILNSQVGADDQGATGDGGGLQNGGETSLRMVRR